MSTCGSFKEGPREIQPRLRNTTAPGRMRSEALISSRRWVISLPLAGAVAVSIGGGRASRRCATGEEITMHTDANNSTQQVAITNSSCREERTFIYHPFESPLRNSGHTLSSTRRPGKGSGRRFAPLVKHLILLRGMSKRFPQLATAVTSAKSKPSELGPRERTMPRKQATNRVRRGTATRVNFTDRHSRVGGALVHLVHFRYFLEVNEKNARRRHLTPLLFTSFTSFSQEGVMDASAHLRTRVRMLPSPLCRTGERSERDEKTASWRYNLPVHFHVNREVNEGGSFTSVSSEVVR
jgi:hypothetical protein